MKQALWWKPIGVIKSSSAPSFVVFMLSLRPPPQLDMFISSFLQFNAKNSPYNRGANCNGIIIVLSDDAATYPKERIESLRRQYPELSPVRREKFEGVSRSVERRLESPCLTSTCGFFLRSSTDPNLHLRRWIWRPQDSSAADDGVWAQRWGERGKNEEREKE